MTTNHTAIPFERLPTHELTLDAGPLTYRDVGSGDTIVFVHGLLVNGFLWRKVVPGLATRFRCIVPDWPLGSHRAPMVAEADLSPAGLARIIVEFLDALDLHDVTLVANDTGGALTQIAVASGTKRIARMVLTPCDMFDNFLPPLFRPLQWIGSIPGGVFLVVQPMRFQAVRNSPLAFGLLAKRPIPVPEAANYVQSVLESAAGISPRYTQEAAEKLRDFKGPTLLAWASEDRLFPVAHAHRMASMLPNARVELIEDSYSFVPEDQPDRLCTLIDDFLSASG